METEMKSQKVDRGSTKKQTVVVNEKTPRLVKDDLKLAQANRPVRCVNYVEVGDMSGAQIQLMLQELAVVHKTAQGGVHYFIPVRHGKISAEIEFEEEFLQTVNRLCEVKDGEIAMKSGSKDVKVVRRKF
jgi:hypothetical protein